MNENYADWPREKLIEHITAYRDGIHDLANTAMKQEYQLRKLRPIAERVLGIDRIREFLHGA